MDRILGTEGGNSTRYTQLMHPFEAHHMSASMDALGYGMCSCIDLHSMAAWQG